MIELLQEINKNLTQNLKRQNERIAEIESRLADTSASDVREASYPAPTVTETTIEKEEPEAAKDDLQVEADQMIEGDGLGKLRV